MWYNRAVTAEWVARISEVPDKDEIPPVAEEKKKKKNKKLKKRTKLAEDQPQMRDVNWEHTMMRKALHLYYQENWMNGPDEYFDVTVDEAPKGFDIDPDHWPVVRDLIRQLKKRDAKYKANGEIQYSHDCEKVDSFRAKTKKSKSCLKVDTNIGETKKLLFVSAKVDCYTLTAEEVFKKSVPVNSKYVGAMGKTIRDISSKELKTGRREYLSGPFKDATIVDLMNSKIGMNDDMPTATMPSTITLRNDKSFKNGWINTKIDPEENSPKLTVTHTPSFDNVGGSCSLAKDSSHCSLRIERESNAINSTTKRNQTPPKDAGIQPRRNDAGNQTPHKDAGIQHPRNDAGNQTPTNDVGNQPPRNDAGSRTLRSDAGNKTPSNDAGNKSPSNDENRNEMTNVRLQTDTGSGSLLTLKAIRNNRPSPCSHRSFDDLIDDFEKSLGTIYKPSAPEGQDWVSSSHSESSLEHVQDECERSPVSTTSPSRESLKSMGEKSEHELRVVITPYFKDDASLNTCNGSQEAYSLEDSWERSGARSQFSARYVAIRGNTPQELHCNNRSIFSRLRRGLSQLSNKLRSLNCCVIHCGNSTF